ncbi:pyridine nucleotide-disulfide oxidoreductase [Bacillus safensis]|uniref:NAD(P)/FAD-dependent oxidoreductase n=1 Tax=Bacillus TaxID=1386 RepID=UPI0003FCAF65|nr:MULTISPECIES: NAD(P)/FAD-dependent oxidoreductase [Bacillus]KAB3537529.1 NAD(P)/FAD-dependent oxidoreductase [Bacillus safensis]KAB3543553.1 NAD(P)/FAD-dependent oxidoreductase [Bacillus safensis]KIZ53415.1 pyridine nucleotide-disulfide oxidoreductase [Bacillus safensis]MBG9821339.1 pyridine nucleotide-disulfide oxidoreductase [Bacillus safensis]MBG9822863.1 pyridine nucleotide-disulfide oxidoreductase [Bacillus safensis]
MLLDCAIIGGGPAGLSAALVVGRGRKQVIVFDDELPRNRVTQESHGFITNDGMTPFEIRRAGEADLQKYPNIKIKRSRIVDIQKKEERFTLLTHEGDTFKAKKIILATGLQDILPEIEGIHDVYGKTLFSCPFCDGWELKDKALALIAENQRALHMAKLLSNWTKDLIVFTNGHVLAEEDKVLLTAHSIQVIDVPIVSIDQDNGQLRSLQLANGETVKREGGFVASEFKQSAPFAEKLGCQMTKNTGIETDILGRTTVSGVFACGDNLGGPAQLVLAAAAGSQAGMGVIHELVQEEFQEKTSL